MNNAKTDTPEGEIRSLIEKGAEAVRNKDIDAIMANYTSGMRAFDAIGPLQFNDKKAYRKHYEMCLSMMQGPMFFEVHEIDVTARDDLAFGHYLCRCGCTDADGKEQSGWIRATVCLQKTNGKWSIVHEHFSVPFDPESGKALCELEPEARAPGGA